MNDINSDGTTFSILDCIYCFYQSVLLSQCALSYYYLLQVWTIVIVYPPIQEKHSFDFPTDIWRVILEACQLEERERGGGSEEGREGKEFVIFKTIADGTNIAVSRGIR